MFVFVSHT